VVGGRGARARSAGVVTGETGDGSGVSTGTAQRSHPCSALTGVVAVLAMWTLAARPVLSSRYHVEGGLVVAFCVVSLGLWGGLDVEGLGLSPRRLRTGLLYGSAAFGVVAGVVLLGLVVPASRTDFHTARADVSGRELLVELLVTIPIGTVLVEELAFRGSLLGLLSRMMSPIRSVVVCSLLFGLWHIPGVLGGAPGLSAHVVAAAVGTFFATFVAGLVFCWLRIRSGSLLASAMAHLATNTVALAVAWFVIR
jgi:uncharacterized protein